MCRFVDGRVRVKEITLDAVVPFDQKDRKDGRRDEDEEYHFARRETIRLDIGHLAFIIIYVVRYKINLIRMFSTLSSTEKCERNALLRLSLLFVRVFE